MSDEVLPALVAVDQGGTWIRVAVAQFVASGRPETYSERFAPCGRAEHGADVAGKLAAVINTSLHEASAEWGGPVRVIAGAGNNGRQVAEGWTDSDAGPAPFVSFSEATLALPPENPNGTVLIAGTGAAVATVTDGVETLVTGAHHGVCGSGLWIGEQLLDEHDDRSSMTPAEIAWLAKGAIEQVTQRHHLSVAHGRNRAIIEAAAAGLLDLFDAHLSELEQPVAELTLVGSLANPDHVLGEKLEAGLSARGVSTFFLPDLVEPAMMWAAAFARAFTAPPSW